MLWQFSGQQKPHTHWVILPAGSDDASAAAAWNRALRLYKEVA
jgi:hypothetical protein